MTITIKYTVVYDNYFLSPLHEKNEFWLHDIVVSVISIFKRAVLFELQHHNRRTPLPRMVD